MGKTHNMAGGSSVALDSKKKEKTHQCCATKKIIHTQNMAGGSSAALDPEKFTNSLVPHYQKKKYKHAI